MTSKAPRPHPPGVKPPPSPPPPPPRRERAGPPQNQAIRVEQIVLRVDRLHCELVVREDFLRDPFTSDLARVELVAKMARFPEQGHLTLPDGWREGLREAAYGWLGAHAHWLAFRLRRRWPVRYRTWNALLYVPYALENIALPPGVDRVVMPVWRERAKLDNVIDRN